MALFNAVFLQMFQNNMKISSTVLLVSPAEHVQIYKKMYFIFNDKCISDSNTYNESGTG